MHNKHVWTELRDDGEKREVRATKFGGTWRIQSKLKNDSTWTYHDEPLLDDLSQLRDILFRKYQRRRTAYEDILSVEEMIKRQTK